MACIHREITIRAGPKEVWAAVRDAGAVHRRLARGFVNDVRLDGDARIVTFANGAVVRELLVSLDDERRRFAYAAVGGRARYHHASMQVFADGPEHTRLVWITDVLPDEAAVAIGAMVEQGAAAIQQTLEHETETE